MDGESVRTTFLCYCLFQDVYVLFDLFFIKSTLVPMALCSMTLLHDEAFVPFLHPALRSKNIDIKGYDICEIRITPTTR